MRQGSMRIWDKKESQWVGSFGTNVARNFLVSRRDKLGRNILEVCTTLDRFVRNEYIRMNDKNGVRLFEEDIVQMVLYDDEGFPVGTTIGVIKYIVPSFVLVTKDGIRSISFGEEMEVIGNMFQNAYLLLEAKMFTTKDPFSESHTRFHG